MGTASHHPRPPQSAPGTGAKCPSGCLLSRCHQLWCPLRWTASSGVTCGGLGMCSQWTVSGNANSIWMDPLTTAVSWGGPKGNQGERNGFLPLHVANRQTLQPSREQRETPWGASCPFPRPPRCLPAWGNYCIGKGSGRAVKYYFFTFSPDVVRLQKESQGEF